MATFIVGVILAIGLYFALRHVYYNIRMGKSDCADCSHCAVAGKCNHVNADIQALLKKRQEA